MVSKIIYKFSIFSDYQQLAYSYDIMSRLLEQLGSDEFIPTVVNQQMPDGSVIPRLQVSKSNSEVMITILAERIDVQFVALEKRGFSEEKDQQNKLVLLKCLADIQTAFGECLGKGYRLAVKVQYVLFEINESERMSFRNKFVRNIPFYEEDSTDEFGILEVRILNRELYGSNEKINVLMTINRLQTPANGSLMVDGYGIEFDINTHQDNRNNRFEVDKVEQFIGVAEEISERLEGEIFG